MISLSKVISIENAPHIFDRLDKYSIGIPENTISNLYFYNDSGELFISDKKHSNDFDKLVPNLFKE